MVRAYSYIRMSTAEQLKGDSVRRQLKVTEAYVREMGWELADIIHDQGVSAFKGKNSEFGALSEFLRLAEEGIFEEGSFLIVESLDRLTRQNVFEAISLLNRIIRSGVNVVTLTDRRTYSRETVEKSDTDLMVAAIVMMRAHEESRMKSVRLASAWEQKRNIARSGRVTMQNLPNWLRFSESGARIEVIENRAKVIRNIFELSRDGWGSYSIAKELNRREEPTWGRSSMWQESSIKKLLDNRAVLGEYQPHKILSDVTFRKRVPDGSNIVGYYPPIIDELLFVEAKEARQKRRTSGAGRKGPQYPNLFTGTLQCGYCGSGIRFMDKGAMPKGGKYLRCSNAILTRKCNASAMRYGDVEHLLLALVREVDFSTAVNGHEWQANLTKLKVEKLENQKAIQSTDEKIARIVDAIADLSGSAALREKLGALEIEREAVAKSIRKIEAEIAEHSMTSAPDREALLLRLNDAELDPDEQVRQRKKVNAEIRRFIRSIKLRPNPALAWEDGAVSSVDPIDVDIGYRNGNWQHYSQIEGIDMHGLQSERLKKLKAKVKIDNLD